MNLQSSDLASWGNFDHQIYMRLMPCSLQPEFSPTLSNMFKNFLCKANYYMLTKKYMFSKPSGNRNVAPICWVCLFLIFFNRAKFQKDWTTFILDIRRIFLHGKNPIFRFMFMVNIPNFHRLQLDFSLRPWLPKQPQNCNSLFHFMLCLSQT